MRSVIDANGHPVDYDAATEAMDKDLREEVARSVRPEDAQAFFESYAARHAQKYLQPFAPYTGGGNW